MIFNLANPEFLENIISSGITAKAYARDINDTFNFMKRTDSGYWTWTMMYHFSLKDTREMQSKEDVLLEAKIISKYVNFVHQGA